MSDLIPVSFAIRDQKKPGQLIDTVRIESRSHANGEPLTWCVKDGPAVLNRDGEWEYEPLPSNRDDAFLQRTRFPNETEAYSCFLKRKERT